MTTYYGLGAPCSFFVQSSSVMLQTWTIKFSYYSLAASFFSSSLVFYYRWFLAPCISNLPRNNKHIFKNWSLLFVFFDKSLYPGTILINKPLRPGSDYFFKDKSLLSNTSRNNLMDYIHYNSRTWIFLKRIDGNWHHWKMPSQNK